MMCIYKFILFAYFQNTSNYLAGFVNNRKAFIVACVFHPSAHQKQTHDIFICPPSILHTLRFLENYGSNYENSF